MAYKETEETYRERKHKVEQNNPIVNKNIETIDDYLNRINPYETDSVTQEQKLINQHNAFFLYDPTTGEIQSIHPTKQQTPEDPYEAKQGTLNIRIREIARKKDVYLRKDVGLEYFIALPQASAILDTTSKTYLSLQNKRERTQ